MIVLDASVLIAHLDPSDAHHERATGLLVDLADDELGIGPLTLAEVFVGPARSGRLDAAQRAIRDLEIATVALTEDAPTRLAALRSTSGLRMPDCCVLLAAESDAGHLATFDDRLARAAQARGLTVHA